MSDDLIFYTNPNSRGRIVRWMLEETGATYETRVLEYGTTMKAPAYLNINPMGKVPALVHGETIITETPAICAYLADAFPETELAPPVNSRLRGDYYRWLFFFAGPFEAASINKLLNVEISEEQRGMVGYGSPDEILDMVERAVTGRDYLVGDRFSAADLYVGSHLDFGIRFKYIDERPAFRTYVDNLVTRPAALRARQMDDKLIAEQSQS